MSDQTNVAMSAVSTNEAALKAHAITAFTKRRTQVGERIYHYAGWGHSNATAVVGDTSVILIDALDSPDELRDLLADLAEITTKPVRTLIYTHGHPDHRGGAGVVRDTVEEVICFAPSTTPLPGYDKLQDVLGRRGRYQHGYGLSDDDAICQGIGPREGKERGLATYDFVSPTTVYHCNPSTEEGKRGIERTIDGVTLQFIPMPGETDDGLAVWFPHERVLVSGDIYYACWPNLYAIRGTQYRDIATWVASLDRLLALEPEFLLPGHMQALEGASLIQQQVGNFRDAVKWVLDSTLDAMNRGLTLEETLQEVTLPERFAADPHLQEFYGTVAWSVASIYTGYLGWFDGAPEHLMPVPQTERSAELVALIGADKLDARIDELMVQGSYQMALELLSLGGLSDRGRRVACLEGRARQMTSANARHYLLACARFGSIEA